MVLLPDRTDTNNALRELRPRQTRSRKNLTIAWLGLGIAAIALTAMTAGLVFPLERQFRITAQHTSVTVVAMNVLTDLDEAQAGENGYLLTEKASYLERFNSSRKALSRELDWLQQLTRHNPEEQRQVETLQGLIRLQLYEFKKTIHARATVGSESALANLRSGRNQQLMSAIRTDLDTLVVDDETALALFSRKGQSRLRTGLAALLGSALLSGCVFLIGHIMLTRSVSSHRRAEEQLKASERRFETLCEQAPLGIYEADADGRCIYTNRSWSAMSGLTAGESLGHGWLKALHPDDRARVYQEWEPAARQGTTCEYRLLNPKGETRWIRTVGAPIYSPQGKITGYVGTVEDITERRLAEDERQKFVSLADRSLEFIGMCSLDLRPFYVNAAGMRLVGLDDLKAACQVKVQDYFFPEDQDFITNEFLPRVLREGHGTVEIRFRHFKTGDTIWMLLNVFGICNARGETIGFRLGHRQCRYHRTQAGGGKTARGAATTSTYYR